MTDKLKRCPFCGGAATIEGAGETKCTVGCSTVGCRGFQSVTLYDSRQEAIVAWNKRAAIDIIDALRQALENQAAIMRVLWYAVSFPAAHD